MSLNSEILSKVPLLVDLKENKEALETIANIMQVKTFSAGETLIEEGKIGDELFVIIKGQASVYKNTPDGDPFKVVILKEEMTPAFGEGGLIEAEPRSASIKTDTETTCLVLTREAFSRFAEQHPQWAIPVLKKIAKVLMVRLRQTSHDLMLVHKALMSEIRGEF